jgi:hypothetical protein
MSDEDQADWYEKEIRSSWTPTGTIQPLTNTIARRFCLHEAASSQNGRSSLSGFGVFTAHHAAFSRPPLVVTMDPKPQSKWRGNVLSTINVTIEGLNLAKELSGPTPAKAVFGTVSALLTMIKVSLPFRDYEPLVNVHPGVDDQPTGLCRTLLVLR